MPASEGVLGEAEIACPFDSRDETAFAVDGMDPADFAHPGWRDQIRTRGI